MSSRAALILFIVGTLAAGLGIGGITAPDGWYAELAKPSFNPPNWFFPVVWPVLYVMIGIAGWRVWRLGHKSGLLRLWGLQLLLNFAWTPTFFAFHSIAVALLIVGALLAGIRVFSARAWPRDRTAALLFLPYAAWTAFAVLLNASIWLMN